MEMVERQSLTIWLYSLKQHKQLRKYGHVHYLSRKMKYVVLYVDARHLDEVMKSIENLPFVKAIEVSPYQDMDQDFSHTLDYARDQVRGKDFTDSEAEETTLMDIVSSLKKDWCEGGPE